jgi:hypothetical protein
MKAARIVWISDRAPLRTYLPFAVDEEGTHYQSEPDHYRDEDRAKNGTTLGYHRSLERSICDRRGPIRRRPVWESNVRLLRNNLCVQGVNTRLPNSLVLRYRVFEIVLNGIMAPTTGRADTTRKKSGIRRAGFAR